MQTRRQTQWGEIVIEVKDNPLIIKICYVFKIENHSDTDIDLHPLMIKLSQILTTFSWMWKNSSYTFLNLRHLYPTSNNLQVFF